MNAIFGRCRILCNVCVCSVGSRVNQAKWDNMTYNCWVSNSFSLTLLEKIRVSYPILSVPFRRRIKVPPTYCSRDITLPIQYNPSVFSLLLLVSSGVFTLLLVGKSSHGKNEQKKFTWTVHFYWSTRERLGRYSRHHVSSLDLFFQTS